MEPNHVSGTENNQEPSLLRDREGFFIMRPTGLDWFDKIVANDPVIKAAGLDLGALDRRLDELELIHGLKS